MPASHRGYSLVELLIALALVALAMAVALPSMTQSYNSYVGRTAADEFATVQALARSTAIKYGRLTELHFDLSGHRYWVQVDTSANSAADTVRMVSDLRQRRVLLTSDNTMLCYDARGIATARGSCGGGLTTVVFKTRGRYDTVFVTAAGQVVQ